MRSPFTNKEMIQKSEKRNLTFRKEIFEYDHSYFYCEDSKRIFTNTDLDELNINQVYNQYREKYKIPFPEEIIALKEDLELSSSKISNILGFGANIYRNYENGEIPSLSNSNLIKAVLANPSTLIELVNSNIDITTRDKTKINNRINRYIERKKTAFTDNQYIYYLGDFKEPNKYTGYRKPDFDKISNMVIFFSLKMNPTITSLNKLLFYSDFCNYRRTSFSISGMKYMAHNYGPVPVNFRSIFEHISNKNLVKVITVNYGNFLGETYYPIENMNFDESLFDDDELETLNMVCKRFENFNAKKLKEISHEELAWIENFESKSSIDFNYGFKLLAL